MCGYYMELERPYNKLGKTILCNANADAGNHNNSVGCSISTMTMKRE